MDGLGGMLFKKATISLDKEKEKQKERDEETRRTEE